MADPVGDSQLVKGTSIVAVFGVLFDLWVSVFMADRPNEKLVRIVTLIFVIGLLYGLWMMYSGWQKDKAA